MILAAIILRKNTEVSQKKAKLNWKQKFPWVVFSNRSTDVQLLMHCEVCVNCAKTSRVTVTNVLAHEGTENIQISSLSRHNDSIEHKQCEKEKLQIIVNNAVDEQLPTIPITVKVSNYDKTLFNTIYYLAKSDSPSHHVNELLSLQRMNGLDVKYTNLSWNSVCEIQDSVSDFLTTELVTDIKASPVFAIMLDERTDITVDKRLSICLRYVKDGSPITTYLSNTSLTDGCAHTIMNRVEEVFVKLGIPLSRCTSLATDGASPMMGKHIGVGKQLQAKFAPFSVQTHCVAHRLNLACVDSIKSIEYLLKFQEKFNSLYLFVSASSSRVLTLKTLQTLLEEPTLSIKQPHSIRWLGLKAAVEAVYECYESVLSTLSKLTAEKNASAKGLYKYFCNYKCALTIAFLLDVHSELAILSKQQQKENLLFSELEPLIDGTVAQLESMKDTDGQALVDMKAKIKRSEAEDGTTEVTYGTERLSYKITFDKEFESMREKYIKQISKNIQHRFRKEVGTVFKVMSLVLEPITSNFANSEDSKDAVEHLAELYGSEREVCVIRTVDGEDIKEESQVPALLNRQALIREWPRLSAMIKGSYAKLTTAQLCKKIILVQGTLLPNFSILVCIGLCMTITSVECECSFSAQNRLKTKFRSSLSSDRLHTLMNIKLIGPPLASFDANKPIALWRSRKRRRMGRLFADYKPAKLRKVSEFSPAV